MLSDDKTKIFSAMRARTQENIARQKAAEYTPTTEQVRTEWVESAANPSETNRLHSNAAFDRWIEAHDAEIRADQIEKDAAIAESQMHPDETPCGVCKAVAAIRAQLTEGEKP